MKKVLGVFHQFIMDSNQVFYAVTASEWRMRDNDKAKLRKRYVDLALSHNLPGVLTPSSSVSHPDFDPAKYFDEVFLCDSSEIAIWLLTPDSQFSSKTHGLSLSFIGDEYWLKFDPDPKMFYRCRLVPEDPPRLITRYDV